VHNGYAVASRDTKSNIAFCTIFTLGHRTTWGVLPWSIVLLCWLALAHRILHIKATLDARKQLGLSEANKALMGGEPELELGYFCQKGFMVKGSKPSIGIPRYTRPSIGAHSTSLTRSPSVSRVSRAETEVEGDGKLTGKDKGILSFVWLCGFVYGCMSDQVLTKEANRACSVREPVDTKLGIMGLVWGLALPLLLGPIGAALASLALRVTGAYMDISPPAPPRPGEQPTLPMLLSLLLVLLLTYPLSMVLVELLPALYTNSFLLIMLKYVVGTSHHLLVPLAILVVRTDLRDLVGTVYRKGGTTQGKDVEMTMEEMQRQLGLGVDCG